MSEQGWVDEHLGASIAMLGTCCTQCRCRTSMDLACPRHVLSACSGSVCLWTSGVSLPCDGGCFACAQCRALVPSWPPLGPSALLQVAEEVAVRVETELGACKQRCFALEGAARAAQREARMLEDALKVNKGVEYDGSVKSLKAEEGRCASAGRHGRESSVAADSQHGGQSIL
eukprot:scaffold56950_cov21-Tisochrysis_lutea.AAC.2